MPVLAQSLKVGFKNVYAGDDTDDNGTRVFNQPRASDPGGRHGLVFLARLGEPSSSGDRRGTAHSTLTLTLGFLKGTALVLQPGLFRWPHSQRGGACAASCSRKDDSREVTRCCAPLLTQRSLVSQYSPAGAGSGLDAGWGQQARNPRMSRAAVQ